MDTPARGLRQAENPESELPLAPGVHHPQVGTRVPASGRWTICGERFVAYLRLGHPSRLRDIRG